MTDDIPETTFATAAKVAAEIYGEDLSFINSDAQSRARIVASMAIKHAYPKYSGAEIARKLGFCGSASKWRDRVYSAKSAKWFKQEDVERVINAIGVSHKLDLRVKGDFYNDEKKPVSDESEYKPGASFAPRRRLSMDCIFIPATAKPRNITSSFCGDPPPGRREMIASMDSRGYRAGNDDGDTTFAREMRRRKAAQRSKDQSAN